MSSKREIYTHSSSTQLPHLFQGIITGEMVFPSKKIWLYSPWISDIPLLDNSAHAFRHVEPHWPRSKIKLSAILQKLLENGTEVVIITNTSSHNDTFFLWIEKIKIQGYRNLDGLRVKELHKKGFLGDNFFINGSMNFTYNGLNILDERIEFTTVPEEISNARIEFDTYWNNKKQEHSE